MENVTLGQISDILLFIIELASSITAIVVVVKKSLNTQLEPLDKKMDKLDKNQCMNYLVEFLADIEHGETKDDAQIQRAYEVYDHYTKDLNGNSYIHDKWNKLMK